MSQSIEDEQTLILQIKCRDYNNIYLKATSNGSSKLQQRWISVRAKLYLNLKTDKFIYLLKQSKSSIPLSADIFKTRIKDRS